MKPNNEAGERRILRVIASIIIIGFVVYGIVVAAGKQSVSASLGIAAFTGFAIFTGVLMSTILGRLYRQHEVREFRLDLANLILVSVLIAMPFAAANTVWEIFHMQNIDGATENKTAVLLVLAGIAAFLLFPILVLTEALLHWHSLFAKNGNH